MIGITEHIRLLGMLHWQRREAKSLLPHTSWSPKSLYQVLCVSWAMQYPGLGLPEAGQVQNDNCQSPGGPGLSFLSFRSQLCHVMSCYVIASRYFQRVWVMPRGLGCDWFRAVSHFLLEVLLEVVNKYVVLNHIESEIESSCDSC